jgi:cytoskeletal protein RodZ
MDTANFGTFLREERERRQVSLSEISQSTKVSVSSLKLIEAGNLDDLPPDVFVRGFIRSYAKRLGIPSGQPLGLLDQVLSERRRSAEVSVTGIPTTGVPATVLGMSKWDRTVKNTPSSERPVEDDPQMQRRGIGLAVFVIIVLLIATITLSLFLRQQPQSGEGLSLNGNDVAGEAVSLPAFLRT